MESSELHILDVRRGLGAFMALLIDAADRHDADKLTSIDLFHREFSAGMIADGEWLKAHVKLNRHHLNRPDGVPNDVNLIDVLDFIADCVMAGLARNPGHPENFYMPSIPPDLLALAFHNTVMLLKERVVVDDRPLP